MRLCCCSCSSCCESISSSVNSTELLHSAAIEEGSQYYTVRRISSFGRTASHEDLEGSYQDLSAVGKKDVLDIHYGSLTLALPAAESLTGSREHKDSRTLAVHPPSKKKHNWRKALHGLKPRTGRLHSKSPPPATPKNIPPITISSPNIVEDMDLECLQPKYHTLALPQKKLRHVLTMSDVSCVGLTDQPQVLRFKSRSMQDINCSEDDPSSGRFSEEARKLARSVGLDVSLYQSDLPAHRRSTEALHHADSKHYDDGVQEHSCGYVHLFITYYPKDKKLLVNVTQLEGLPPRNDFQDYAVVLKVQILPPEKSAKTAKLRGLQDIDEDFYFSLKDPQGKAVKLSVFDADRTGKHDAIGHTLIHLDTESISATTRMYSMKLYKQSELKMYFCDLLQLDLVLGSLLLTMNYDSDTQRFTMLVTAAANLCTSHLTKTTKHSDKVNTYVKLAHYRNGEKVKSKKSGVVSHDQNPKYNHQFQLKMPGTDEADSYVVVSVVLKGLLKDETVGRLVFGPHCYTAKRAYTPWGQVMMGDKTLTSWYKLYL